jgi:type I restriction enzyme, S subunit
MEVRPGYKLTEVGVIPDDWDCVRICDVARLESGHTPRRTVNAYWNGPIPWVSLHDTNSLDHNYIYDTAMTVTQQGIDNSSARLLPAGTVVFSRTATVGKAAILGRSMATSQDFATMSAAQSCAISSWSICFVEWLGRGTA